MSEWKTYKLCELCKITSSKRIFANEYTDFGVPFYRGKEIIEKQKGNRISTELFITQERYDEIKMKYGVPQIGDMLLTSVGTLGIPYIVEEEMFYFKDGNLTWFYDFDELYSRFLYYWFLSPIGKANIDSKAIGSTQKALTIATLSKLEISLPPLAEQKRIADILSAIDDKIELNRRINANLEQQAQALYKSWFVDFEPFGGKMPEDWREGTLNDILEKIATGLNPRKNFVLGKGNNYYVTIKNMGNNNIYLDDKCDKVDDEALQKINNRSRLQKGDILFSGIGTIGRTYLIDKEPNNWNTSESVFNLRPIKEIPSEFLYLLLLSDWFQQYVNVHAQGAVQQGIRMGDIKSCPMRIPTSVTITNFTKLVKPMISEVKNNQRKNLRLAQLRDTLLPKLMSGEIVV